MPTFTRLRALLTVLLSVMVAMVAFAGPASAVDAVYPPPPATEVLSVNETAEVPVADVPAADVPAADVPASASPEVAGVSESAGPAVLAFTGANAVGISALAGLLLVGGGLMLFAGKRRKLDS